MTSFKSPNIHPLQSFMSGLLSRWTVGSIGLTCKAFLNTGYCSSVTVNGLENLQEALYSEERNSGRGVITGACSLLSSIHIVLTVLVFS